MKNKKINLLAVVAVSAIIFSLGVVNSFAQNLNSPKSTATSTAKITARVQNLKTRADKEITRRINGLNKLVSRIQSMQKISDSDKSSLSSTVQDEISTLNALNSKISGESDVQSLLTDVQSVTKSYRIYALVIPQGAIMASADRVLLIVDVMNSLILKIQSRIIEAQTAGKNVSAMQTLVSDINAKIADAKTQAQNAINKVVVLKPDNGDKTVMQSNTAALKDARTKIHAAQQDFVAARKDARQVVKDLQGLSVKTGQEGTSTSSTSTSQ